MGALEKRYLIDEVRVLFNRRRKRGLQPDRCLQLVVPNFVANGLMRHALHDGLLDSCVILGKAL
jgi:hypothetical protein